MTPFRPHFVLFDKKTLKFMGFFRQHVPESRVEHYRIRYVNIFYYLEDDTITVIEPVVKVKFIFMSWPRVVRNASKLISNRKLIFFVLIFLIVFSELRTFTGKAGETRQNIKEPRSWNTLHVEGFQCRQRSRIERNRFPHHGFRCFHARVSHSEWNWSEWARMSSKGSGLNWQVNI